MLNFTKAKITDIPALRQYFAVQSYRTCDYTIGGYYMWAEYFGYTYTYYRNTLYIKGSDTLNPILDSYALPIGVFSIKETINLLLTENKSWHQPLVLNTIPESVLSEITDNFVCKVEEMVNWSDYIYDIRSLSTLVGHRYNKKRNQTNQFKKKYPNYQYKRLDASNIGQVKDFFELHSASQEVLSRFGVYENLKVKEVLNDFFEYPFVGATIAIDNQIVAFTIAEIQNDTVYIHIEKADYSFDGAYTMIFISFLQDILEEYPNLEFVNREEDMGDIGLKKSKLSYLPCQIIKKYRIEIDALLQQ